MNLFQKASPSRGPAPTDSDSPLLRAPCKRLRRRRQGFTLVEIMVTVIIIGLLVLLAVPYFRNARENTQNSRFMNDLRMLRSAVSQYAMEYGVFPVDATPGILPPGMEGYSREATWTELTTIGGQFDWDFDAVGVRAGVAVVGELVGDSQIRKIDEDIDDGDLSTGIFQKTAGNRVVWIIEEMN